MRICFSFEHRQAFLEPCILRVPNLVLSGLARLLRALRGLLLTSTSIVPSCTTDEICCTTDLWADIGMARNRIDADLTASPTDKTGEPFNNKGLFSENLELPEAIAVRSFADRFGSYLP